MTTIFILLVVALVYWFLPKWTKIVLFLINIFMPDPIPYIDEVLMLLMLIKDAKESN